MVLGAGRDGTRDDAAAPNLVAVALAERQPGAGDVGGDHDRLLLAEREDVELKGALADLEEARDQLLERLSALELAAVADGRGDLARIDDRARPQVLFDRPVRQEQVDPGEPQGDDEDGQRAEDDQLVPDAEMHDAHRLVRSETPSA